MAATLKKCPFCQSHFVKVAQHIFSYNVECSNCHATGPRKKNLFSAVLSWNHLARKMEQTRSIPHQDLINRVSNIERTVHKLEVELRN